MDEEETWDPQVKETQLTSVHVSWPKGRREGSDNRADQPLYIFMMEWLKVTI